MGKIKTKIKRIIKKLILGNKYSSEAFVAYLRGLGMRIGEGTTFFAPSNVNIDIRTPWMIEIGDNVQITYGVSILTHGFDWAVLKGVTGEIFGSRGKVKIGNNVFIGTNATILKGVTVGNNVIIGAGSTVTKDLPDNCVAVGSPAKPVMTLDEYYEKRKAAQYEEASELVREYRLVYGKDPSAKDLSEFFWLFTSGTAELDSSWKYQMKQAGNEKQSYEVLKNNKSMFASMEEFLHHVK